jgi:hypothetical protein
MKLKVLVAAIAAAGLAATAVATTVAATSAKTRSAAVKAEARAVRKDLQQAKVEAATAVGSEVGDPHSFGRYAKYIGLMNSGAIYLTEFAEECVEDPEFPFGPDDRCVVLNPQPAVTTFDFPDVGRMVIPAKASTTLFCHTQTPIASTFLYNGTAAQMSSARIVYNPNFTFENVVLADPSLINPVTGLPFNGKLTTTLAGIRHQLTLQPNESFLGRDDETRFCIAGMVSKRQLIETYGLTDAQATEFFKKDTIVTMGISGQAQGVISSSIINNVRWLGD